jgi:5'-deoxynucleotidase YfbR-like HD superfamily hydrolase
MKTQRTVALVKDLVAPLARVDRQNVMPFDQKRHENSAEHNYILTIVACSLVKDIDPTLDTGKVAQLAAVHEITKVYTGDTTVWEPEAAQQAKAAKEADAVQNIRKDYSDFPWIAERLDEYRALETPESRYVYALDKIVPHIMIVAGDFHPVRPTRAAYKRTEVVAREQVQRFPKLMPLFDELCQKFAKSPHYFSD